MALEVPGEEEARVAASLSSQASLRSQLLCTKCDARTSCRAVLLSWGGGAGGKSRGDFAAFARSPDPHQAPSHSLLWGYIQRGGGFP